MSDDTISRKAAIDAIAGCTNCGDEEQLRKYVVKHGLENGWTGGVLDALDAINDLPPVEPKRMKGYWAPQDFNKQNGNTSTCVYYFPKCSVCGHVGDERFAFCPNCGADMRGE